MIDNETLYFILLICIVMCLAAIGLFIGDIVTMSKINKRLEKFNKWYEEYEKDKENKKLEIIKEFEKWYKENKDE